ncbi:cytochrome c biogenesis CcdA family protein [Mycobacteroides abscessus]|uniref:cytochrome c biogenesis CcdA family protein n=1 Tax=Mycobacteroides abscessus TaxID=36809 RepID=UPI0009411C09|nr:cytochrome c biogenesis CcdA family protein [Mycobacteroides abscessus]MBN7293218.1 cytochrome c biogenesis protein CcdA [Mycobacteroides abscessus subsp. abscessus]MBN7294261.1 cytochrome c biogenesis protein CcdA [Mycobacteroides abscessus subsp. abscessus]MBN7308183.1 cytochrome c biogenesis protein CcdA [Mycobacteroides abscessus subsp. abscessus]MBN7313172.1 cytochrome c biogenesis protein CcdA [Mycobacteroides abscessus subsp. abscessus]MBN7325202.1 cytochrome c biogenesis protein Ccd
MTSLAFAAGLIAALNPCGFALLPVYLALVVRGPGAEIGKSQALARAVIATVVMAGGFVAVFTVFGLLTVSVASVIQRYLPFVTVVFGIGLVILGLWLLAGRDIIALMPKMLDANAPTTRLGSMFGYGVGYAVASLSCTIGPFLAVTSTTFESGSLFDGVMVYLAYASGITLVVGTLAVSTALASTMLLKAMRRALPYLNRVSGAILIVVGAYVGYYGSYEVRLFHANGNPDDPIINAAGKIQRTISGWVYLHGAWPWLFILGLVAVGAAIWWRTNVSEPPSN